MANEPVQVVTNPERLRGPREKPSPNGAGKDFFADDDAGFAVHRDDLARQIRAIVATIEADGWARDFGGSAHVKISMRRVAIAKSYRPQTALFSESLTPHVATARIAEPIYAVTAASLRKVLNRIESLPDAVKFAVSNKTGELEARPARGRCEASGIISVDLWSPIDKLDFGAVEAAAWLRRPGTGGNYLVNMFPLRPGNNSPLAAAQDVALRTLETQLGNLPVDAQVRQMTGWSTGSVFSLRVLSPGVLGRLELGPGALTVGTRATPQGVLSSDVAQHSVVLEILARNPLVRSISLPAVPTGAESTPVLTAVRPDFAFTPRPLDVTSRVGVIDGGVSEVLGDWVEERFDFLDPVDKDSYHGTFISGLLIAAAEHNPGYLADHGPGCLIFDVGVLPADPGNTGVPFESYYPRGIADFFDEVETAVKDYRQNFGVRVFNFSMNFVAPGNAARYGDAARRLDEIARQNDVIFVISAGNLDGADQRAEWHKDPEVAIARLVGESGTTIAEPAESLFNMSVSALNPPGLSNQVPHALTKYSRRGPGLRGATKPDFAQVGGSGTHDVIRETGLLSLDSAGNLVSDAGTSFAAPLVAKQLADLVSLIEGEVSRETLIGLMVHHATIPKVMKGPAILHAARDIVGFGIPALAEQMLEGPDSEITLVFKGTVLPREQHTLVFAWPEALVDKGSCRGYARLTLVARPILAYEHGDERVRVNIDAKLMQEEAGGGFKGVLYPVNRPAKGKGPRSEPELLEAQKWQVVKSFESPKMRGRGNSSTWKFLVEYLTRAEEQLPTAGVEFAAILTISDPEGGAPVFQQMRQQLGALGIQTSDIRTAIRTRVGQAT